MVWISGEEEANYYDRNSGVNKFKGELSYHW
jgi:hypothetical protein